jgi:hypothetical protein
LVEHVLILDPVSKFPETSERPGYLFGFNDNIGDALISKISRNYLDTALHRSDARSAENASHQNERVTLKPVVQ